MMEELEPLMRGLYPYAESHGVLRDLPAEGRSPEEILEELREIARKEDSTWESGRCSGSMYSGDHEHYAFLNSVCALFSHVNALQRDMCPSMTRFESDILAMSADIMHGEEVSRHNPGTRRVARSGSGARRALSIRSWSIGTRRRSNGASIDRR